MSRFLLDTNVLSNVVKPQPSTSLMSWWSTQRDDSLFISTLTIAELRRGILEKPAGKKRSALESWFAGPHGPQALFAGRILAFDDDAALVWAGLMADGTAAGRPRSALDMVVAATAIANGCTIVTDNERDFAGLPFINPLRA